MMFGYGGHGGDWPVWGVALMWLGMVAVVGLLIWAIYAVLSASRRRGNGRGKEAAGPARILDERLARGEIDAVEYKRLREALASGSTQLPADAGSRN